MLISLGDGRCSLRKAPEGAALTAEKMTFLLLQNHRSI